MTKREIIAADDATQNGPTDSVLRTAFTEVTAIDDRVRQIIQDLKDTLHSDTLSVGLAAPQIGYKDAVAVVNLNKDEDNDLVLVNPKIVSESGSWDTKYESCMSIPHKRGNVKRRKKIQISYFDENGNEKNLEASSFKARVIMHEIDHLNGILYVDRMEHDERLEETEIFREHGIE